MLECVTNPHRALAVLRLADAAIRVFGWQLLEASINQETGRVLLVAEARDERARSGIKLTLLRSPLSGRVMLERSRVELREGFCGSAWEVGDWLGTDRFDGLGEALAAFLHYTCGNDAAGAVSAKLAERRLADLARDLVELEAKLANIGSEPASFHSLLGEPMAEEWLELDHTCCLGDGWDPYIPSVPAGSDTSTRRWVTASGTIVDGRGVHREGTFARGPNSARAG